MATAASKWFTSESEDLGWTGAAQRGVHSTRVRCWNEACTALIFVGVPPSRPAISDSSSELWLPSVIGMARAGARSAARWSAVARPRPVSSVTGVVPKLRDRVTRSRRSCGADIQMGKVAGKVAGALSHFLAGYVWAGATFRWYDRDAFDATSPVLQQLHMQPSFISGLTPRRRQREELAPLASYWSGCSCRALALPCLCCIRNCAYRGVLWGVLWGPHQSTKVLYAHHNGRGGWGTLWTTCIHSETAVLQRSVDLCDKGPIAMLRQPSKRRGVQNNLAAAEFAQHTKST